LPDGLWKSGNISVQAGWVVDKPAERGAPLASCGDVGHST
jgi:hypothetical protein